MNLIFTVSALSASSLALAEIAQTPFQAAKYSLTGADAQSLVNTLVEVKLIHVYDQGEIGFFSVSGLLCIAQGNGIAYCSANNLIRMGDQIAIEVKGEDAVKLTDAFKPLHIVTQHYSGESVLIYTLSCKGTVQAPKCELQAELNPPSDWPSSGR